MPAGKTSLKAADVVASVRRHYGAEFDGYGPEWAALDEFSLGPGGGRRRADLFLVRTWGGQPKGHERHCIEVKVSRADLRAELAKPAKSAAFFDASHRFYLAVPHGLVKDTDLIPADWGIYEISMSGRCRKTREATRRDPDPMTEGALVEAFRRAARSEARIRGADSEDSAARVVDLERQIASLNRSLHTARTAADRDRAKLQDLLTEIAHVGGWLCVCGARMKRGRYENSHADGSRCTEGYGGRGIVDMDSLAVRLGITDEPSSTAPVH